MSWWRDNVPHRLGDGYERAILDAIRGGKLEQKWHAVEADGLRFEICDPLSIDGTILLGLSAKTVDAIALELGDVMSPTTKLWDLASMDRLQQQIGPHTQINGLRGMRADAAKQHADAIANDRSCGRTITGACKTYVLHPGPREGYACEYGWRLDKREKWGTRNDSHTGYVVQPAQWAHSYADFWDYSMGAVFVRKAAALDGSPVDLGQLALRGHRSVCNGGPVPWLINPSFPGASPAKPPLGEAVRFGDSGAPVVRWQQALISNGYSLAPHGADGFYGRLTYRRTTEFQRGRGLVADGIVGPKTRAALKSRDKHWPPPAKRPSRVQIFGAMDYKPAPTEDNPEAITISPDWTRANLQSVHLPQLEEIDGAPSHGTITFHRRAAAQLQALWQAWEDAGLLPLIKTWSGAWAPRFIRGSRTRLSNHAYGSAFDINYAWNKLGAVPAPAGAFGSVVQLVPHAREHGFAWGGAWSRADGMHFEIERLL